MCISHKKGIQSLTKWQQALPNFMLITLSCFKLLQKWCNILSIKRTICESHPFLIQENYAWTLLWKPKRRWISILSMEQLLPWTTYVITSKRRIEHFLVIILKQKFLKHNTTHPHKMWKINFLEPSIYITHDNQKYLDLKINQTKFL